MAIPAATYPRITPSVWEKARQNVEKPAASQYRKSSADTAASPCRNARRSERRIS